MWRLLFVIEILWCGLLMQMQVAHAGRDYWEAFKFVGGFLGFDYANQKRASHYTDNTLFASITSPTKKHNNINKGSLISLIGAGFGRTGTKSTEAALVQLGHNKIYDTRSMLELNHTKQWIEAAIQINKNGDLRLAEDLLLDIESRGYTATLDFPMNLFSKTFAELRPSAKVLFTMREDTDKWYDSWRNVTLVLSPFYLRPWNWIVDFTFLIKICEAFGFPYYIAPSPEHISRPLPWYEKCHFRPAFDLGDVSRERWIAFHNRIRKELEESLPASRFLAFDVRQGWAPLLTFLQLENQYPELIGADAEPFPNVNDIESLKMVRNVMDIIAIGLPLWLLLLGWLCVTILYYIASIIKRCCIIVATAKSSKLKSS